MIGIPSLNASYCDTVSGGTDSETAMRIHHADTTLVSSHDRDSAGIVALAAFATGWTVASRGGGSSGRGRIRGRSWLPMKPTGARSSRRFTLDRTIINLNNGGCSPSPRVVHEAFKRYLDISNQAPVYHMWQILEPNIESVRRRLAAEFGCDPEELAITRNASEALQIAQLGHRSQGRRRSRDHQPGLRPHARHLGAARAPRRHHA